MITNNKGSNLELELKQKQKNTTQKDMDEDRKVENRATPFCTSTLRR